MTSLMLAALSFIALHLLISATGLRDRLVARVGLGTYRHLFSVVTAGVLGWLIWAYGKAHVPQPTPLPEWRWLASPLIFVAFCFMVLGLLTPGPTLVYGEKLLDREDAARGIHRVTRHPFMWGVSLWAVLHMLFNPDASSLVFFGTFALVATAGTFSMDAKRARSFGDKWARYAQRTSNIPFAAIVQKRNMLAWSELGLGKLAAAAAAFAAFAALHGKFFGVAPL